MQIEEDREWVIEMPAGLNGLAVALWGVMMEVEVVAIALAIVVEAHRFISTRWRFTFAHYVKAWQLSAIFAAVGGVLYYMDGYAFTEMRVMLLWLPLLLSPLIFVQNFGEDDCMPLNTFSFVARRRMKKDIEEDRVIQPWMINFGVPYFLLTMLSGGLAKRDADFWGVFSMNSTTFYTISMAALLGVLLFILAKRGGRGIVSYSIVYGIMLFVGSYLVNLQTTLEQKVRGLVHATDPMDIGQSVTRIGQLGELKQSRRMHWRMWVPEKEVVPTHVPMGIYNSYNSGHWTDSYSKVKNQKSNYSGAVILDNDEGRVSVFAPRDKVNVTELTLASSFRLLSTMSGNKSEALIPQLPGYIAYGGLVGKDAVVEKNQLGAVKIVNPDATLHCNIWVSKGQKIQVSKPTSNDLLVPRTERIGIARACESIKLANYSDREKVSVIEQYFLKNFEYSTHLNVEASGDQSQAGFSRSALENFLTDVKEGHCEYFASAATLMLREVGVPARYVTGYVTTQEQTDDGAYVMRGTQAHAWCQAWINNKWVTVETTPPSWLDSDMAGGVTWQDKLSDFWKGWREDFQLWRSDAENAVLVNRVILAIVGLVVVWIVIRLWFAKNKRGKNVSGYSMGSIPPWKIMKKFDKWCSKLIGPRPVSMPYGQWVTQLTDVIPEHHEQVDAFVKQYHRDRFGSSDEHRVEDFAKNLMAIKAKK